MLEKLKKFGDYIATSLASSAVDIAFFYIIFKELEKFKVTGDTFLATIFARIISSIVAYVLNRRLVFKSEGSRKAELIKHFTIVFIQMMISASFLTYIDMTIKGNEVIEKCFVDAALFFLGYFLQKYWVYKDNSTK